MSAFEDHVREEAAERRLRAGKSQVEQLRVDCLIAGKSPRVNGEDYHHTGVLAAIDTPLPPILVHRSSLQVVDGMHRLRAAQLRGQQHIEVEYVDGSEEEAFVLAVKANTKHGLPLTRADRESAAARIVAAYPRCSDRWLAAVTGLAASTVAAIRRRTIPDNYREVARIGQDGKVRPISSADARVVASDVMAKNPEASLREVAKIAGISPTTVRDVRERMRRGDDPIPPRQLHAAGKRDPAGGRGAARPARAAPAGDGLRDRASLLRQLRNDPSVRFTDSGRALLRWLEATAGDPGLGRDLIDAAPPHCVYIIAELARRCAQEWLDLAAELQGQARLA